VPNELVATIHPQRMPVILDGDEAFETWTDGTPDEAHSLVNTYTAERMEIVQSGPDRKDLVEGLRVFCANDFKFAVASLSMPERLDFSLTAPGPHTRCGIFI